MLETVPQHGESQLRLSRRLDMLASTHNQSLIELASAANEDLERVLVVLGDRGQHNFPRDATDLCIVDGSGVRAADGFCAFFRVSLAYAFFEENLNCPIMAKTN